MIYDPMAEEGGGGGGPVCTFRSIKLLNKFV